jgi:hypothetical protein
MVDRKCKLWRVEERGKKRWFRVVNLMVAYGISKMTAVRRERGKSKGNWRANRQSCCWNVQKKWLQVNK